MRIGECADLSFDCLRSTGPNQWAIHVPLGKLKTERMVPVDSFVVTHPTLTILSFLDPLPADGRLLARPGPQRPSFVNSATIYTRSAILWAFPHASSRIS